MNKLTSEQIEAVLLKISDLYFTDKLITVKNNTTTLHGDDLRHALEQVGEGEETDCSKFPSTSSLLINMLDDDEPICQHNWDEGNHNVYKCKKCGMLNIK